MNTLLVTGTADSTGKTAVALGLGLLARERGRSVGYMKPKGTRLESAVGKTLDTDPMLARDLLDLEAEVHRMEPVVYSPTFVEGAIRGREDPAAIREEVRDQFDALAADADVMLVEGTTYTTGGVINLTDPDLADLLEARVLLVVEYEQPGDIDGILAAAEAFGDRLAGVLFNRVADSSHDAVVTDVVPALESRGIDTLGVLPRTRELAGVTVENLAAELGADRLTSVGGEAYVERFLVGAMGADQALRHFRRTKDAAVITGGDRADVLTAAVEAPGVNCIVVTGGHRPSSAVLGAAEEVGLAVLAMNTDTLTAVERAEEVVSGGRARDESTVRRMRELLFEHAEVDSLLDED